VPLYLLSSSAADSAKEIETGRDRQKETKKNDNGARAGRRLPAGRKNEPSPALALDVLGTPSAIPACYTHFLFF
jgi:hypothetical protein